MAKIFSNLSPHYTEIKAVAGGALVAGSFQTVNEVNGFPLVDIVSGDEYTLITKTDKAVAPKDAVTVLAGEAIYWNSATSKVTNVAGSLKLIGYATEGSASGDDNAYFTFDGMATFLKA